MDLNNLAGSHTIASPAPSAVATAPSQARPEPEEKPYEPMIHGESAYDRVTSMLMSVVVGAAIIVGWLWLVYTTQNAYAKRIPSALEIIEVTGGGGSPDGEVGGSETVEIAGAAASDGPASNNTAEDASKFEEAEVQATNSPALDAFGAAPDDGQEGVEMGADAPRGGFVASGRASSKKGNGRIGLGPGGPGDGGVTREQRWLIVFPPGQSADEYARQLDAMKVELATAKGSNTLVYASNFTGTPLTRTGLAAQEKRWYNTWANPARKQYDAELMKKAGIIVGNGYVLQCFPESATETMARLEVAYKGRQPAEIRATRFTIVPSGGSYTFQVTSQDPLK